MNKLYNYLKNRLGVTQKILTSLLLSIVFYGVTQAQDYKITFSASGESTTVDSVQVLNITQAKSISLKGTDTLNLVQDITRISDFGANKNFIRIYPNPMTRNAKLEFVLMQSGEVVVQIFDLDGKLVAINKQNLEAGKSIYYISGVKSGTYLVKIQLPNEELSTKLISTNRNNGVPKIHQLTTNFVTNLKSATSEQLVEMQYNEGDSLIFTGFSGSELVDIIGYVPTGDANIEFNFESQIIMHEFILFVRDVDSWTPIDPEGALVVGASVKLLDIDNPDKAIPLYEGVTDSNGKLVINNVSEEIYFVYIEKEEKSNIIAKEIINGKEVGFAISAIFLNQAEIEQSVTLPGTVPGDPKLIDVNGDGILNRNDKTFGNRVTIIGPVEHTYFISEKN
ncbi:MAG: T9SS type A sorting domain-containing protein [Bacteroidales bacterium]|nr:T9SS type A sorting domain-containing protein [Bacteroidales bacterium]